jgi:hypothetical protein
MKVKCQLDNILPFLLSHISYFVYIIYENFYVFIFVHVMNFVFYLCPLFIVI